MTFGRGCLHEAGIRASALAMTRVALFTDPFLKDSAYVSTVSESLAQAGLDVAIFDEINIEADDLSVERGAAFIADGDVNVMVSVGGVSVMDTAKAAMFYVLYPSTEFLD